nr:uncharacterized protein LOC128696845 [Cherax quadricarinatus]
MDASAAETKLCEVMSGRFKQDPPSSASSDSGGEDIVVPQMEEDESITEAGEMESSQPTTPRPPSTGPQQTPTQGKVYNYQKCINLHQNDALSQLLKIKYYIKSFHKQGRINSLNSPPNGK